MRNLSKVVLFVAVSLSSLSLFSCAKENKDNNKSTLASSTTESTESESTIDTCRKIINEGIWSQLEFTMFNEKKPVAAGIIYKVKYKENPNGSGNKNEFTARRSMGNNPYLEFTGKVNKKENGNEFFSFKTQYFSKETWESISCKNNEIKGIILEEGNTASNTFVIKKKR